MEVNRNVRKNMEQQPLVGVILVNYNGYNDTVECVDSIKKNKYSNYVIVIVDNGASENDILNLKYGMDEKVHIIASSDNLGFAGGNNLGCQYAIDVLGVEYVLLLNNDTCVDDMFLVEAMKNMIIKKAHCIITGRIICYYDKQKLWYAGGLLDIKHGIAKHIVDDRYHDTRCKRVGFASGCFMLVPVSAYLCVKKMCEDYFLYYEDADFSCALVKAGYPIYYCNNSIIYHKVNASTGRLSPTSLYYSTRNRLLFVKKNGSNKAVGYFSTLLMCFRSVIKHPKRLPVIANALIDFLTNQSGKWNK